MPVRQPRIPAGLPRLEATLERVIVHAQRTRVAAIAESNVAQRRRRAPGDFDDRALRNASRLADGESFRRAARYAG